MTTLIDTNNIQPATLAALTPVTITSVQITDSSWTVLDDSAVSTSGGYIVINGNNFQAGCNVIINNFNATSVTVVSSTQLRVVVPAYTAGTYVVYVTNTNGGTAIIVNGLTYSATPTWVTSSPLPGGVTGTAISIQLSATGDTPLVYSLQAGSSLPSGLTLSSSGLLSGTVTVSSDTTYNFTVVATDPQLQDSPKAFAITIISGDLYWPYVTTLLSASTPTTLPFIDDASTNNFAVTIVGGTRPYNFNPYTPGYYSNYFDGSGDYLYAGQNAAFAFGTGDFTVEFWVYTSSATSQMVYDTLQPGISGGGSTRFYVYINSTQTIITGPATNQQTSTNTITLGAWNHVAVVRSGTTRTIYINGVSGGSATLTNNLTDNYASIGFDVAAGGTIILNGYLSNLRVVKGTAVYTAAFTPPTAPLTAITNTSLLTCQSNRLIDNSTNNFTITKNGDTTVNPFIPYLPSSSYNTYGAAYFNGSTDYLTTSGNAAFAMSTGNFTYEAWIYPISISTYWQIMGQFSTLTTGVGSFCIPINSSRQIELYYDGQSYLALTGATVTLNSWNHIAIVRTGSTITGYINGVVAGTITYSGIFGNSSTNLEIGATTRTGSAAQFAYGYIADVRIVKGTAVYTTAFTPPSAPLTAIANTSLLTCQTNQPVNNNIFIDNSTNNLSITRNGNTTQGTFSPYGGGFSNYFNGSTDYLTAPSNAAFAFGTGNFTVEAWVYITTAQEILLFDTRSSVSTAGFGCRIGSDLKLYYSDSANNALTTTAISLNTWTHVAWARNGSTLTGYINGVSGGTASNSNNITQNNAYIGRVGFSAAGYMAGYISNLRVVKGTAVYTANFTPSTTPLQPIAGTSLLTCQSPNFVDNSANNFTITRNGTPTVQRYNPFGGVTLPTPYYGAYFDGSGDYLTIPDNSAWTIDTDYTIEFWVYSIAFPGQYNNIVTQRGGASSYWGINYDTSLGWSLFWNNGSGETKISRNQNSPLNTWVHIAVVKSGTTGYMFINGTQAGATFSFPSISDVSSSLYIGAWYTPGDYINGYLSNLRMVKGTAVYTSNFTPPTSPLTAVSGTSLLTCQSATFIDNSTNNFTITANGNSQPTRYNPFTVTYSAKQSYTPAVFGGSMYFDGTGDYLSSSNSAFAMGTGSFTWEAWIYNTGNTGAYRQIFSTRASNATASTTAGSLSLQTNTNYLVWFTSAAVITTSVAVPLNSWSHVAIVRNGTAMTLYLNGISVGIATNSDNLTASVFSIGANNDGSEPFMGYISDVRVTKNQAVYTSAFVPQNAPLQAVQNSVLLVNGTSAGIYDSSENSNFETLGDTKLNTSTVKFSGTTSMYFDGTGDYLFRPNTPLNDFGTGDFTIEMWVYRNGSQAAYAGLVCFNANNGNGLMLGFGNGDNKLRVVWNNTQTILASSAMNNTAWTHVALVRYGATVTCYQDGISVGTYSISTSAMPFTSVGMTIGRLLTDVDGYYFTGYLDDLRITKGVARYTSNFTPPTSPFITK